MKDKNSQQRIALQLIIATISSIAIPLLATLLVSYSNKESWLEWFQFDR
jgi:hypothetical protein